MAHYRSRHSKQKRFDDWKTSTFGYTFELCAEADVAQADICQSQPVLIQSSRFGASLASTSECVLTAIA